jgi:hypothetical protein
MGSGHGLRAWPQSAPRLPGPRPCRTAPGWPPTLANSFRSSSMKRGNLPSLVPGMVGDLAVLDHGKSYPWSPGFHRLLGDHNGREARWRPHSHAGRIVGKKRQNHTRGYDFPWYNAPFGVLFDSGNTALPVRTSQRTPLNTLAADVHVAEPVQSLPSGAERQPPILSPFQKTGAIASLCSVHAFHNAVEGQDYARSPLQYCLKQRLEPLCHAIARG